MGWDLFGWSFDVLRKHKQLLLFPILSGVAAIIALILGMALANVSFSEVFQHLPRRATWVWVAPVYVFITFVVVFFNCALAACANAAFNGAEPTVSYGINHAAQRMVPILGWAVLSTTVGFILQAIERRVSIAGKIAVWLFGAAWGLATYLVIPVLIAEDRGAFGSVQRSVQLFRNTWDDQLVARIRFGWRGLVFFLPTLLFGVLGMNGLPVFLPVAVACFIVAATVLSAAQGIFAVALYRFAATGESPAGWSPEMLSIIKPPTSGIRTLDI